MALGWRIGLVEAGRAGEAGQAGLAWRAWWGRGRGCGLPFSGCMLPATATEPGVQPPLLQLRAMNDEAAAGVHAVPGGEGGAGGDTSQAFKLAYARVVLQLRDVSGRGRWSLGLCCAVLCAAAPNTVSPRRPRRPPPCLGWAEWHF